MSELGVCIFSNPRFGCVGAAWKFCPVPEWPILLEQKSPTTVTSPFTLDAMLFEWQKSGWTNTNLMSIWHGTSQ